MPDKATLQRAERDRREGKAPSTQAGEFVREEIEHVREGKHGARSTRQAIAIGLSKARRAGIEMPPPRKGSASRRTRRHAARDTRGASRAVSTRRSRATLQALTREGRAAGSRAALSRQARGAAVPEFPTRGGPPRRGYPEAHREVIPKKVPGEPFAGLSVLPACGRALTPRRGG